MRNRLHRWHPSTGPGEDVHNSQEVLLKFIQLLHVLLALACPSHLEIHYIPSFIVREQDVCVTTID
jgi:hypothetical protein